MRLLGAFRAPQIEKNSRSSVWLDLLDPSAAHRNERVMNKLKRVETSFGERRFFPGVLPINDRPLEYERAFGPDLRLRVELKWDGHFFEAQYYRDGEILGHMCSGGVRETVELERDPLFVESLMKI